MSIVLSEPPVADSQEPKYGVLNVTAIGAHRRAGFFPDGFSLWRVTWDLAPGSRLQWSTNHGDEAIFILNGTLEVEKSTLGVDSALIVEAGVSAEIRAVDDVRLLHFGPTSRAGPQAGPFGPAETAGRRLHLRPYDQAEHIALVGGGVTNMAFFADGTCATCRIAFFMAHTSNSAGYTAQSHTHSEDEIIHVLDGTLTFGSVRAEPGMSLAIPSNVRYGFRSTGPFRMLNYRRDASTFQGRPGAEPFLEIVSTVRESTLTVD